MIGKTALRLSEIRSGREFGEWPVASQLMVNRRGPRRL
jgi:hypothetical protein